MTQIANSMHRAPVEATPRQRLTPAQKAEILERQHDLCAGCGETLIWTVVEEKPVYGPMIDEHILPLWLGGSNDLSNRELRCVPCAKAKTREDKARMAKAERQRRKAQGEWPKSEYRLRGRGFRPGRNRSSELSKT